MSSQQRISDYSSLNIAGDVSQFLEKRMENDGNDNPIFVGYNRSPNAPTDNLSWFIVKIEYSGTAPIRYQLPDEGPQFKYAWDDRATYFS